MSGNGQRYTAEQRAQAIAIYLDQGVEAACRVVGVSPAGLRLWIDAAGVTPRRGRHLQPRLCGLRYSAELRARAVAVYLSDGVSAASAATGASATSIAAWVAKAKVRQRPAGRVPILASMTVAEVVAVIRDQGSLRDAADVLGVSRTTLRNKIGGTPWRGA